VRAMVWAEVHPDYLGQGVGATLARWLEQRGQRMVDRAPQGTRVVLVQEKLSTETAAHDLLKHNGYQLVRHSLQMLIKIEKPIPAPELPAGVAIRPLNLPDEDAATVEAIRAAFKGHWGHVQQPFEDDLKEWQNFFYNAPNCDPELLLVAVEGEQIIGTCFNVPTPAEGPESAWIFALGVLPIWRRRGLGLALLQHSFAELYRKGKTRVSLSVDAHNLSGATQLYEKAGMHIEYRYDVFERELRPGDELS
jgi:mycothiol synthase